MNDELRQAELAGSPTIFPYVCLGNLHLFGGIDDRGKYVHELPTSSALRLNFFMRLPRRFCVCHYERSESEVR